MNCLGIRRDESAARARRIPWRRNDRMSVAGREVFDWLPIFDLSTADVFDVIRNAGQSPPLDLQPPVQVFLLLLHFLVASGSAPGGRTPSGPLRPLRAD